MKGMNIVRLPFFFLSFFLWLGISLVLILVFHFLLFSNLTLILYFLFLPQADMDSLEGNDTPKSSHKPFHQSHKPHTHHQLQEGAIRMARSFSRHTPPPHPATSPQHIYPLGTTWLCRWSGFHQAVLGHFLGQCPSKQSIQDNHREPSEPPRKFTYFPLCCAVSARFWPCRAFRPRSWRHCGMQRPCLEKLWAKWKNVRWIR